MGRNWTYDPDMPIDTIMRRWPATIEVLIKHRMLCVGCPIGAFHSVTDACKEHGIDEGVFVGQLRAATDAAQGREESEDKLI